MALGSQPGAVIVVGREADIPRALEHPALTAGGRVRVAGIVSVDPDTEDAAATERALAALLNQAGAGLILVAGPVGTAVMRVISDAALLHRCGLLAVMPSEVVAGHDPVIVWAGERPLVQLQAAGRPTWKFAVKRALDLVGSAMGLVVLAPLFVLTAVLLRLDSRGPIFFRHQRVGFRGTVFNCLKFRTMVSDAEARLTTDAALAETYRRNNFRVPDDLDPRVTRLGRVLRRTSLDELPQLINVLRGEMSLVGPRPVVAEELSHFSGAERMLLSMRPGMTGQWAVSGRHSVAYPARAAMELTYVREWSLVHDVEILANTARAVLQYGTRTDLS